MKDQLFTAYLKLEILPDAVKAKNKIKVGASIPRYEATAFAGDSAGLEALKNKKGQLYFYLQQTKDIIKSPDNRRADCFLQGTNSFNLSSIYSLDDSVEQSAAIVGFGNPPDQKTYGKNKPNPFWESKDDGFLFLITPDWKTIEILILQHGKNTILGNAIKLSHGGYNNTLEDMRKSAGIVFDYWAN